MSAHEDTVPSARLIAQILADGLTMTPMSFDPAWLAYTNPPDLITKPDWDGSHPFEAVLHMLRYQVADLHRMAASNVLDNPYRFFGVESPTGHTWYNFEPQSFLYAASCGQSENQEPADRDWGDLAIILWLGQIYE